MHPFNPVDAAAVETAPSSESLWLQKVKTQPSYLHCNKAGQLKMPLHHQEASQQLSALGAKVWELPTQEGQPKGQWKTWKQILRALQQANQRQEHQIRLTAAPLQVNPGLPLRLVDVGLSASIGQLVYCHNPPPSHPLLRGTQRKKNK